MTTTTITIAWDTTTRGFARLLADSVLPLLDWDDDEDGMGPYPVADDGHEVTVDLSDCWSEVDLAPPVTRIEEVLDLGRDERECISCRVTATLMSLQTIDLPDSKRCREAVYHVRVELENA
jgi:hypothetical protein